MAANPPDEGQSKNRAVACYNIPALHPFRLFIDKGSVVNFSYPYKNPITDRISTAIAVGYAGGDWHSEYGVAGALARIGGPALAEDRRRELRRRDCPAGGAVVTGPNFVGQLRYVIHAHSPAAGKHDPAEYRLLAAAYASSLGCGERKRIEAIGFSLFSAGYYGPTSRLEGVLRIAVEAMARFGGYEELREVHLCAFTDVEADILVKIASDMGLENAIPCPGEERVSYGDLGWERACDSDGRFRWERAAGTPGTGESAYVRTLGVSGELFDGKFNTSVKLVDASEGAVDSVVKNGRGETVATRRDIISAQGMSLDGKIGWFRSACARLSEGGGERKQIDLSHDHLIVDPSVKTLPSVKTVMSFSREDLRTPWSIRRGAEGVPLAEWYESTLSSEYLGLWQRDEADATRMRINLLSDSRLQTPEMACPQDVTYFRFWGRILGKALLSGQYINFKLSQHLYKMILGWPLVLSDLQGIDDRYHKFLRSLKGMGVGVNGLGLHFTMAEDVMGLKTKVPLIPNGQEIPVSDENLPQYVEAYVKYHLFGRCEPQLNALLLGFFEVVPEPLLVAFDFQEVEALMCGYYTGRKMEENMRSFSTGSSVQPSEEGQLKDDEESHNARRDSIASSAEHSEAIEQTSPPFVVEATLVPDGDEPVYDAIQIDGPTDDERKYRMKHGQCPTCGMQTHKIGMLKTPVPLDNQHVLKGRCLNCNPIQPGESSSDVPEKEGRKRSVLDYNRFLKGTLRASRQSNDASQQASLSISEQQMAKIRGIALQEKRRKEGLCAQCGTVKTHKKTLLGMKPVTVPGEVYKGVCLNCSTLEAPMTQVSQPLVSPVEEPPLHAKRHTSPIVSSPASAQVSAPVPTTSSSAPREPAGNAERPDQGAPAPGAVAVSGGAPASAYAGRLDEKIRAHDAGSGREVVVGAIRSGGDLIDEEGESRELRARAKDSAGNEEVLKLSYGVEGWERLVLDDDVYGTMLQWTRQDPVDFAYVRKLQVQGSGSCVTLVPPDEGLLEPTITRGGKAIMDHNDLLSAQKMSYEEKVQWFRSACSQLCADGDEGLYFNVRRGSLLTDSIEFVMPLSSNDMQRRWTVGFVGEKKGGTGWLESVAEQVFNPSFGLFDSGDRGMRLQINTDSELNCAAQKNYGHLVYFRFVGRCLGKAVLEGQQLTHRFATHLYKSLLGWPVTLDDLKDIDEPHFNFLTSLASMGSGVDHLGLNFATTGESSTGPDVEVNERNLPEYIDACLKHQTWGKCNEQLSALVLGFYDVVPEPLLVVFDFRGLQTLLCGTCIEGHAPTTALSKAEINEQCECLELLAEESLNALEDKRDSSAFGTDLGTLAKYASLVLWPETPNDFVVGLRLDAVDQRHRRWFVGSVIEIVTSSAEDKAAKVKVHFDDCSSKWDEEYTIDNFSDGRLYPLHTHTPELEPIEFAVHHRGLDGESKSLFLFGNSLHIQCQNEWSAARAGAYVLSQASKALETSYFKCPSDGNALSPVERAIAKTERRQTRAVIASVVEELVLTDTKYIATAVKVRKGSTPIAISVSLSKKMDEVLPLLPFELRITMADQPLGTTKKEALFSFAVDRTVRNYMGKNSITLHWRKERSLAFDQARRKVEAEKLRTKGSLAFDKRKLTEAIALYTKAIEANPTDHQSLSNRSAAYLRIGDEESAMRDTRSILLLKPECPKGYYHKGAALSSLERYEDAASVFEEGLRKYPGDAALTSGLAGVRECCPVLEELEVEGRDAPEADSDATMEAAAIVVQSSVRSWECQKTLLGKRIAVTKIQSVARMWRCQAAIAQMKVAGESEDSDDEAASLDALALCAREAAKRLQRSIVFVPQPDGSVPPGAELLCKPLSAPISDLTMQTYWRKADRPVRTKATLPTVPASPDTDIDDTRARLSSMNEGTDSYEPISLPPQYVDEIRTDTILGKGYYGKVVLGLDHAIGRQFAIKLIEPLVIEQSLAGLCTGRLESIKKTFSNEIKVLSSLRHPNICPLYGYCMNEGGLANTCLLYELAINGSLDRFWKDMLGRERLSDARVRARIAFEVATVLRFMHEGLDGEAVCYHRDIKSANICLTADFHVRVVDVGLSKYVTEPQGSFSSAGPTGTPGYTCPEYLLGGTKFTSACDVFSFGVFLCDLITGKTSSQQSQHYLTYRKSKAKHRSIEGDADRCVDWGSGNCLKGMTKLASKCMRSSSSDRPSIGRVVRTLQQIINGFDKRPDDVDQSLSSREQLMSKSSSDMSQSPVMKCRLCGETSKECIQCTGSQRHTHCHNCVESSLTRNVNRFQYDGLCCLKGGCDSQPYPDETVAGIVSRNVWGAYSLQRQSGFSVEQVASSASQYVWNSSSTRQEAAMIASMETRVINLVEDKFRQMQDLQVKLSAGNGLPCPKLFYLVEADSPSWRQPREWAKNTGSVKLYLYFVCSHSLEPVSENCRIKLRYSRDWLKAVAPALNVSLDLLALSLSVGLGRDCPLSFAKIEELDEWAKNLLDDDERSIFEEAKSRGGSDPDSGSGGDKTLQTLVGNSLSCVAERAASSNIGWQSELVPVYDSVKKEPTFVKHRFASDPRYQSEREVAFSP